MEIIDDDSVQITTENIHGDLFWLYALRALSVRWERMWQERPATAEDWWVGRHAGLLFRLREIYGGQAAYCHGSMCAPGWLSVREMPGRRFPDNNFETRKKTLAYRKAHPTQYI